MKSLMKEMRSHMSFGLTAVCMLFCSTFLAADHVAAAAYSTNNGEVVIEAENYTRTAGTTGASWYKNTAKSGYRGSGYMQASTADPSTLSYSSSISRVEYDINFKETGTYYLHLRTWAKEHSENGFFATMDGKQFSYGSSKAYFVYVHKPGTWQWYTDGGGAEQRGLKVSINITKTGTQTLGILRRDKGSKLDRIWLTKNRSTPITNNDYSVGSSSDTTSDSSDTTSDSSDTTSDSSDTTSDSSGSGTTFVQDSGGMVTIDAYDYTTKASGSNHSWAEVDYLNIDAMEAIPDSGTNIKSGYVTSSPYLSFNINFQKTGTHYVWLQASCLGSDNTAHVGLNSNTGPTIKVLLSSGWNWSNTTTSGGRATITVSKTGVQPVKVYMREDGMILRQITLTTSSSYAPSGDSTSTDSDTSSSTTTDVAFQQATDTNGLVVMHAQSYDAKTSRSDHSWSAATYSGVSTMETTPDNGSNIKSGYVSNSPYLRFNVNFEKTGTHYVHLRGLAKGNDNTFYVGLNGNSGTAVKATVTGSWTWSSTGAQLNVTKTGLQTVEVYMREDGSRLNKVLITKSSSYKPSGSGPAESDRE